MSYDWARTTIYDDPVKDWDQLLDKKTCFKNGIEYYKAFYENKQVWVHAEGSAIIVEWLIDEIKLEKYILPDECIREIYDYVSQVIGSHICPENMYKFANFLEKYLPYLQDGTKSDSLKYITLDITCELTPA